MVISLTGHSKKLFPLTHNHSRVSWVYATWRADCDTTRLVSRGLWRIFCYCCHWSVLFIIAGLTGIKGRNNKYWSRFVRKDIFHSEDNWVYCYFLKQENSLGLENILRKYLTQWVWIIDNRNERDIRKHNDCRRAMTKLYGLLMHICV